jgi:hypothetical protein
MQLRHITLAASLLAFAALPLCANAAYSPTLRVASFAAAADGELTMDSVTRAYQMSADISAKGKADPAFADKMDKMGPENPDLAPIAEKNGFTPADYFTITSAYMRAGMAYAKIKGGEDKATAIAGLATNDADVDFITANYDALKALDGQYPNPMMTTP